MNAPPDIEYGLATLADIPAVVELCMLVEQQHEDYWPLHGSAGRGSGRDIPAGFRGGWVSRGC